MITPITASIHQFCMYTGLGQTLVREMIADGRLEAVRVGKKKLIIIMQSYLNWLEKQKAEGLPEYSPTEKAVATRKQNQAERKAAEAEDTLAAAGL
jgi:excisionase family DNA binding protein